MKHTSESNCVRRVCIFLLVFPFFIFSCFADYSSFDTVDLDKLVHYSNWHYGSFNILFNPNHPVNVSYYLGNYLTMPNGSIYESNNSSTNIVCCQQFIEFSSSVSADLLNISVPSFLQNVGSLSFDLFFGFVNYNPNNPGNVQNVWTTSNYVGYFNPVLCVVKGSGGVTDVVNANVAFVGVEQFKITDSKYTSFFHYIVSCPNLKETDYEAQSVSLVFNNLPSSLFLNNRVKFQVLLGFIPDNFVFSVRDPQLGIIENSLDSISDEVVEQTDRILYEVSQENQVIINDSNSRLNEVKQETNEITSGLSQTDDLLNNEEISSITSPEAIIPEGYDEVISDITTVTQDSLSDTPLEIMLILVFSLATVSYILFGKKGIT